MKWELFYTLRENIVIWSAVLDFKMGSVYLISSPHTHLVVVARVISVVVHTKGSSCRLKSVRIESP